MCVKRANHPDVTLPSASIQKLLTISSDNFHLQTSRGNILLLILNLSKSHFTVCYSYTTICSARGNGNEPDGDILRHFPVVKCEGTFSDEECTFYVKRFFVVYNCASLL